MVAEEQMDVILFSGGSKIPTYRDYMVFVEKESPGYLILELYPNVRWKPMYYGAILNGVEIFKLNNFDGNLAGPNPDPPDSVTVSKPKLPRRKGKTKTPSIFKAIIISIVGFAIGLFLLFLVMSYKRIIISLKKKKEEEEADSSLLSDLCCHFTINEIRAATCDFDEKLVIGVGGFGNVYNGRLAGGDQIHVAVKRLNPKSKQGAREFKMLSHLRHRHLVSLIGYCYENGEMILVYEYMPCINLSNHLYNTDNPPLPWKQRLKICIGAASGLHYLHRGAKHTVIHRDVRTSNILLDERFVAKVSDFGLSKVGPTSFSKTQVSTMVKGSFGYLDPEYYGRQLLTEKSDVYSFGVVLCEVLRGRPPLLQTIEKKQMNVSEWVRNCHQEKKLHQIVDPYLVGKIAPECLKKFSEIAVSCMLDNGAESPSMKELLRDLEFAMQLQNNEEENIRLGGESSEMTEDGTIRIRCGWEDKSGSVFSDIKGLQGR